MRAIILKTTQVKDDDLIALLASSEGIFSAYRFYGCRHSAICTGRWIDFELERSANFLPKLRSVMHLRFEWQSAINSRAIAHKNLAACMEFNKFCAHLSRRCCEGEFGFYYEILLQLAWALNYQDYMRASIDAYIKILRAEGHLGVHNECFKCAKKLKERCCMDANFALICKDCANFNDFNTAQAQAFLSSNKSAVFEDDEIEKIYELIYA